MDLSLLLAYLPVVFRELWEQKFLTFLVFVSVAFTVLLVGMMWPVSYTTSATIYADNQNILKPLLAQQAAVTKVSDQIRVVRDVIHSPRMLRGIVQDIHGADFESAAAMEFKVNGVRSNLKINGLGSSYIKIGYSSADADETFDTLNMVIDRFIRETSEGKRSESKEAFQFIDKQVKQYKEQLLAAEENLKQFNAANLDGRGADVSGRISGLRSQIESMKIDIDEGRERVKSLESQLKKESRYSAKAYTSDIYRNRLNELEERLNSLLLTYKDSYPDVVSLRLQIEDTTAAMREAESAKASDTGQSSNGTINPLYEELRSKLAEADVELNAKVRRMQATERLLEEEYERSKRIAARQAELAELTRDYTVTKKIYDDMLERKEKARLSMTLNVEGQGVTYKIQEPAVFPLKPEGLRFIHFVVLGPMLALLAPIGLSLLTSCWIRECAWLKSFANR